MFKNQSIKDKDVKKLSAVLAEWIKYHLKKKSLSINTDCIYWQSMFILEAYENWNLINKIYPNPLSRAAEISTLIYGTNYYKVTGKFKKYPLKRLISKNTLKRIYISIRTSLNIFKLCFFERIIVTNKDIENCFGIKKTDLKGNIIFSNFIVFLYKKSSRMKLKKFLEKESLKFDIDILIEIIPDYLVELLPVYSFFSSRIKSKEIRSWVPEIYYCPLLIIKCFMDINFFKVGYQHGGSYGFIKYYSKNLEYKFYNKFVYWGITYKDIYPFKFGKDSKFISKKKIKINFKDNLSKINIYNDRIDSPVGIDNYYLVEITKKIKDNVKNTNIILHPFDYEISFDKFISIKDIKIFKGDKDFSKQDNNGINIVSVFGTLFWEMIYKRKFLICIYPKNIGISPHYNSELVQLLKFNKLIYSEKNLLKNIGEISLKEILNLNVRFYHQLSNIKNINKNYFI